MNIRRVVALGVSTLVVAALLPISPAGAASPPVDFRTTWPCAPSSIYIDGAAPKVVALAVTYWRRMFRPDWTLTRDQEAATVQVLMRRPLYPGAVGLTSIYASDTTRTKALVEIDPNPELRAAHHLITLHELGHVAGLEHNDSTRWAVMAAQPVVTRYSPSELTWMAAAARMCQP